MRRPLFFFALLLAALPAFAFPPAPYHVIYGEVRDQYGTPLITANTKVMLQTASGIVITGSLAPGKIAGENYELQVPMDAGLTSDLYKPNALLTAAPFRLYVIIGNTTNLPIQMTGNLVQLGKPGQRTHLDLTLGVDANGNGIPDAWENAFLATLGLDLDPATLKANLDYVGDGMTLMQEFLTGNYPFNPGNSFTLKMVDPNKGAPVMEFTTMTGRSYTLLGSSDLRQWTPVSFVVPAEGTSAPTHSFYFASDIRTLRLQALPATTGPAPHFFKLLLQ